MKCSTLIRHAVLAGALAATASVAIVFPQAAHAAQPAENRRVDDPAVDVANRALALLNQSASTGDTSVQATYERTRAELATEIGQRLDIDPATLNAAWARADIDHQRALLAALGQLGVPYRRNTSKPGIGFDCSGLTTYAWAQAGFSLQRSSSAQIRVAVPLTAETAQAGDLVQYPGHVMMSLGVDRAIVHTPGSGRTVEVDVLSSKKRLRFGDPTA